MFLLFLPTFIVIGFISSDNFPLMLAGAFLLIIVGTKDDLVGVGASRKFAVQIVASGLLVYIFEPTRITAGDTSYMAIWFVLSFLAFRLLARGIIPRSKLFHSVLEPRNKSMGMHISSAGELTRVDRDDITPQDVQSKVLNEEVE